jgi:hypothetical protein
MIKVDRMTAEEIPDVYEKLNKLFKEQMTEDQYDHLCNLFKMVVRYPLT